MTAILFPGQGAQFVGMGKDMAERYPAVRALFDRAGAALGYDLAKICFEGPEAELTRSDRAQPAIFVVSLAALEALRQERPDFTPAAAAGLSSGEWAALCAAGVVDFEDALRILKIRGEAMQAACERNPGAMLSVIGLERAALEPVCAATGAEIANLNSPEQTVLSGTAAAIAAAEAAAKAAGAKMAVRLNVAGAFHSSLMAPAAETLRAALAGVAFRAPRFPALSNVTGAAHGDPESIRDLMVRQVTSSVRWVDDVAALKALGVARFVECGPGRVLCGLVKRIDRQAGLCNIQDLPSLQSALAALRA